MILSHSIPETLARSVRSLIVTARIALGWLSWQGSASFVSAGDSRPLALVVGCDYSGTSLQLPSPGRDAERMAETLRSAKVGFEVKLLINPNRDELRMAVGELGRALAERKRPGLFYFSGHGAQFEGENYVIPIGARLTFREDLMDQAFPVSEVMRQLGVAMNGPNLLFLDACRDCPLPPRPGDAVSRSGNLKGLAQMSASGLLIGFAADSGKVALDSGAGSHYTNALIDHLTVPGLSVSDLLTRVRQRVKETTDGKQEPFVYLGLDEIFTIVPVELVAEKKEVIHPVPITLSLDKLIYESGDKPEITLKAEKDCHVALFYRDAEDGILQLFPNARLRDTLIRGGGPDVLMPRPDPNNPGEKIAIEIFGPPFGKEEFIAFAMENREELESMLSDPKEALDGLPFSQATPRGARVIRLLDPASVDSDAETSAGSSNPASTEGSGKAESEGTGTARVTIFTREQRPR